MKTFKLIVEKRDQGKKSVKAVRTNGSVPVEIYGKFMESNISGAVSRKELVKGLHTSQGKNIIFDLEYEGKSILAVAHDMQIHPVKTNIIHVDFIAVKEDQQIVVTVPVTRSGRSLGEIAGGKVFQVLKEVKVSCRPADIPSEINVDVTEKEIGDRIKISELPYPQGVTPVFHQDSPVIVVNKGRGQSATEEGEEEKPAAEKSAAE
ncbi:MAG TPA: 50S ribosomal protein L25 [bacterium]|jgi:large subunit ribosomal protein L25|nr:50S ribosomal protein L25 [bacterium]HNW15348.1 50S ribosomal protein L25 [bacterium]HOB71366.1 50S ribosomal protein L25 [bacterium]HOG43014.1 50S ribosomal protein L25 [bacterium]HPG36243.1 50S ribosomal protein L25 [bacterium]